MLETFLKYFKEMTKPIVISFFFTSFFVAVFGVTFHKPIQNAINTVNKISFEVKEKSLESIAFDKIEKRLLKYPSFGSVWAKLKISKIDLDLPVYHGDSLKILRYGVGHLAGSYFPGEGGGIIMDAHNSEEYFRRLPELKIGDMIVVEAIYGKYTYEVIKTDIIKNTETNKLPIKINEEQLMLYTCYPVTEIGFTNKRYVVYAKLVDNDDK